MKVINDAPYPVIAFGSEEQRGYGKDVVIPAGGSAEISGPYLGEMGGGYCYVHLEGEITCHEGPDDDDGFQVIRGTPLCLSVAGQGVTVRHHLDEPEQYVTDWRLANQQRTK